MASAKEEVRESLFSNDVKDNDSQSSTSYEEIAIKLLKEKFLLTALELHAELCEAGKELPVLREFFSNPNNFESQNMKPEPYTPMPRSSSQATLDSLDMTRYSEDGGGVDEKVAILEFELRKAKENISALRANLTVVTESESTTPDKSAEKHSTKDPPIKPHEQRALNFLVNEYLLEHSYKLTSITFGDENEDQDFEDWDDVGLNIPKPVELLQMYREFMRAHGHDKPPSISTAVQVDFGDEEREEEREDVSKIMDEIEQLKQRTLLLEKEKSDLQQILSNSGLTQAEGNTTTTHTMNSSSTTPDKFELLESPAQDVSNVIQEPEEDDSASIAISLGETDPGDREWTRIQLPRMECPEALPTLPNSPSRRLPSRFKKEVMSHCMVGVPSSSITVIEEPLKDGITRDTIASILAHSLPRIVPNVILNKREEMIPLLLSAIRLHTDSGERDKLLQLLFNLKKKPQEDERRMIMAGLIVIVKLENGSTEMEEILAQCWEQSQHKYLERRLLAAECCSALAPYTSNEIRNSLMLPMLQQLLLDDKEPVVRAAVVRSLTLLIALMDDPDKYFQCEELALTALDDAALAVVNVASTILVPILAEWALSLKRLQSHLLPRVISKLKNQLKPSHQQYSLNKEHLDGERIISSITVLRCLLPHMIIYVADNDLVRSSIQEETSLELPYELVSTCHSSIVNPKVFYESDVDVAALLNTFLSNTWEHDTWPELEWLANKLVPDIIEMARSVEIAQENIFSALLTYIHSLCTGFGRYITQSKIQTVFVPHMTELETQLMTLTSDKGAMNLTLIPAYLIVLSTIDATQVVKSLKKFIMALSMNGASIASLQVAVVRLCHQENMQEHVLGALWDGVVHQRSSVRCTTVTLFSALIAHVSDRLTNARIAPAIVTLASDSDLLVRAAAIPALGRLVTECGVREVRDKGRLTLETIAREFQGIPSPLAVSLVSTFAAIAPHCPQNYIEDVIATQLAAITASALQQRHKIDLAGALVDVYSVLVYCPLSSQCVNGVLLPGLKYLDALVVQVIPQQREVVRSFLKEAESRQDPPKSMERSSSASSGLSLSMASVNVGQGVEDMRQRMSKMFQQKSTSSGMPSIFRKK